MKKNTVLFLALTAALLTASAAQAQFSLKIQLDRKTYLQYEQIYTKVTLRNMSGHPLAFGDNPQLKGDLMFEFETPDGKPPELIETTYSPLFGQVIEPGETTSVVIPLLRLYKIRAVGKYKVTALIQHTQLADKYKSDQSVDFSVTNGLKVWETTVGVPSIKEEDIAVDEKIKTRKFKIVTFYDGIDKIYSLIVEDDLRIYGITRIGFDIGNGPPAKEIDRMSKVHILAQAGPSVYSYYVYDINCNLDEKNVFVSTQTSTPTLVRDPKNGSVVLAGGKKGVLGVDFIEVEGKPKLNDSPDLLKQPSP